MPAFQIPASRRLLTHALAAALVAGGAAALAWSAYDRIQAGTRVRALADDGKAGQDALGYLYLHAGHQSVLVAALAKEIPNLPPAKAAQALRVAAQSCAKADDMNPGIADAARALLPRLEAQERLLLLANLGAASVDVAKRRTPPGKPFSDAAINRAFNKALGEAAAAAVGLFLKADDSERAVKTVNLFGNVAPIEAAATAGLKNYLAHLEGEEGAALLRHVAPLNDAALWGAASVPPALYNRWLAALAQVGGNDTRQFAVDLIRMRPHAGDYPELGDLLLRMVKDADAGVRLSALRAATEWARPEGKAARPAFAAAIAAAAQDADPAVAREAWITLGLLGGAAPAVPAGLAQLPSPVAEAAYDTLARARPRDETLAAELARILEAGDTQAISAAHALTLCDAPAARQALVKLLAAPAPAADTIRQLCQWRAILALPPEDARALLRRPDAAAWPAPLGQAAAFAAKEAPADLAAKPADDAARQRRLAALEGLPPASATFNTPEEDAGLAFYALAKAEKDPAKVAAHLRPLFASKESVWRDQACLLAAKRLDKAQATELARDLLATPADEAMMSGALLAGLSKTFPKRVLGGSAAFRLEHPEWTEQKLYAISDPERAKLGFTTLDALTDNLNRWGNARTAKDKGVLFATQIGLALRGDTPANLDAMLFDQRIPASTVLLGMLALDADTRRAALDVLLGDDTKTPFVPRQLMADWRFGEVVAEFLPKEGPEAAPRIPCWGDVHLQKLEFERLRAWWRLRKNAEKAQK